MFEIRHQAKIAEESARIVRLAGVAFLVMLSQIACGWWEFHPSPPSNLRGECPAEVAVGDTIEFRVYLPDHVYSTMGPSSVHITPNSAGTVRISNEGRYEDYEDAYFDASISFTAQDPGPVTLSYEANRCNFVITTLDQPEDQTVVQDLTEIDREGSDLMRVSVFANGVPVEPDASLIVSPSQPVQLEVFPENFSGPVSYSWEPADGLSDPLINNPVATTDESATYTVTATDSEGNQASQTISLQVDAFENSDVSLRSFICDNGGLTVRFDGISAQSSEASAAVYEAHVAGLPFACSTWSGLPESVLCAGSLEPQGTEALVQLVAESEGRMLYSAPHAIPMCSSPSAGSGSGSGGGADPDPTPFVCPPPEDCS